MLCNTAKWKFAKITKERLETFVYSFVIFTYKKLNFDSGILCNWMSINKLLRKMENSLNLIFQFPLVSFCVVAEVCWIFALKVWMINLSSFFFLSAFPAFLVFTCRFKYFTAELRCFQFLTVFKFFNNINPVTANKLQALAIFLAFLKFFLMF